MAMEWSVTEHAHCLHAVFRVECRRKGVPSQRMKGERETKEEKKIGGGGGISQARTGP